jgi:hypothetical protein
MSKVQSFLPYDCTTVANYKAWAMGIGDALSTLGWSKTTDQGQVIWADVTTVVEGLPTPISTYNFQGAWSGGTAYIGASATQSGVVTSAGLTYFCIANTQLVLTQALQNSSATLGTGTAVGASSGGVAVYTVASGVTSSMIGQQFIATGYVAANNNGTFICTATSGTTSITLSNPNATVATVQTGTLASSSSVLSFIGGITSGGGNAYVGHSLITSITGSGNSGTFTVTSSSTTAFAVTATGTNATAAGTAIENTAPISDPIHWLPYNYEVWKSGDSLSSTNPIYLRLLYLSQVIEPGAPSIFLQIGSGTSGNGYLTGNLFNSGLEINTIGSVSAAQGVSTFECDFSQYEGSFGMMLWRNLLSSKTSPFCLIIDRAKDNYGNDLDTFEQIALVSAANTSLASQVLFKPSAGYVMPFNSGYWPGIFWGGDDAPTASTISNGKVAAFPLFPIVGYVANPCLQAIYMSQVDIANGAVINTVLYGAEHTYLMGYVEGSQFQGMSGAAVGLRWD